ncbi:MAG: MarR family transcriptional regulator [Planctomycetia bacterium]|nr:MarR family transcriptional regulator [Planctomycetia bacterium]
MHQNQTSPNSIESSDAAVLDLMRRNSDGLGVTELAVAMGVTATAVRQRLNRLIGQGLLEKAVVRGAEGRGGRGRPSHRYRLTALGRRAGGTNFGDLAIAMWKEIRAVKDPEVRRGLLGRLSDAMADMYGGQAAGTTPGERMHSVAAMFQERKVPFSVDSSGKLPVLVAEACPYPGLPEQDHSLCAMERLLFSKLVDHDVRLTACRLDGANCCTFEMA